VLSLLIGSPMQHVERDNILIVDHSSEHTWICQRSLHNKEEDRQISCNDYTIELIAIQLVILENNIANHRVVLNLEDPFALDAFLSGVVVQA
jgi:hypothetical protein